MKDLLEYYYKKRNDTEDFKTPDPLVVLRKYRGHEDFDYIALCCALFSYGNAKQIVKFLEQIDFSWLRISEEEFEKIQMPYYRFQTSRDVKDFFAILRKMRRKYQLRDIAFQGYRKGGILGAIDACITNLYSLMHKTPTGGMRHLISKPLPNSSALKRYNLFFRWLVRKDNIDFGYWNEFDTKDLIIPLDTHISNISRKLGLLNRKASDIKSAILVTEALKQYDSKDPVKYDFALYRIGQEKIVI